MEYKKRWTLTDVPTDAIKLIKIYSAREGVTLPEAMAELVRSGYEISLQENVTQD